MATRSIGFIGIISIFTLLTVTASAQYSLNVPTNSPNTRFYSDVINMNRPALSISGFDNGGNHNHGYGLKQILEMLYNGSADPMMADIYNKTVQISGQQIINPFNNPNGTPLDIAGRNSNRLQSLAFVALARYVLYKNGITAQIPGATQTAPPHDEALSNLRAAFLLPASYYLPNDDHTDDLVHRVRSTNNYARAIDLYLALENAYKYWNEPDYDLENSTKLLTKAQKESIILSLGFQLYIMNWRMAIGIGQYSQGNAEAGNRPMKIYLSMGYNALALQNIEFTDVNGNVSNFSTYGPLFLSSALAKMELPLTPNRSKYWAYQSGYNVNNYSGAWAEGADYFEFALYDVIPFWHAIRLNGLLNYANYDFNDPFHSTWFTRPLHWLFDVSTPDGATPPLDDGNRQTIRYSHLLNWSSTYGDASIGRKYKWIQNKVGLNNSDSHTLLVSLAIPKVPDNINSISPPELYGNQGSDSAKDQVIIRKKDQDERLHYLLINGEHGASITHGEGHEQPDQLQLLYHVDGQPLLLDAGYDAASITRNSTWNGYHHHNTMSLDWEKREKSILGDFVIYENRGGLESPYVDLNAGHKKAIHNGVNFLKYSVKGSVIEVSGEVDIAGGGNNSVYNRNVLFISDEELPYFIDMNSMNYISGSYELFKFRYHLPNGSYNFSYNPIWATIQTPNLKLHHWTRPVERSPTNYNTSQIVIEESNDVTNANQLEIKNSVYLENGNPAIDDNFNIVSIIAATSSNIANVPQEISTSQFHRGWFWKPKANVIDVIIKRSKINTIEYNSTLNFDIYDQSEHIIHLKLGAGLDYGFARLKKENGVWNIDSDYQVNLIQTSYFYTSNHTISSSHTYPSGSRLYISDNVTLTFTGTVNLNNAEVFLGENAKIDVRDNGKIVANNTAFKRLHVNKQHKGVQLRTDNNSLYGSSVTGGQYGLYATGSHNNSITYSSFTDNEYGIYLSESDNNTLAGVDASNNTLSGLRFYKSDATIEPYYYDPPNYAPTEKIFSTFRYNGTHAIDLDAYSSVWLFESILEFNGSHDITIDASSKGYFGNHSISVDQGKNKFGNPSSPGRYIYSYAKTGTSENQTSWTVPARYNFWHNGSAPSSSEFYGSVNYSNHLTEDPTFYVPAGSLTTTDAPVAVLSASMAQAYVQPAESRVEEQKILHLQQQLAELQEKMQRDELTPLNARWLKTYRGLLQFAEAGHLKSEREQSRAFQNKWLAQFHRLTSLSADSLVELEQGVSFTDTKMNRYDPAAIRQFQKKLEAAQIVGETAVLLEVEEALQKDDFNRVHNLYGKYGSYVHNKDNQSSLLAAVSLAYQGEKEFGKAIAAIEAIEEIKPDADMMEHWEAPDLEDIKMMLRDSARVHNQITVFEKAVAKDPAYALDLPQQFSVSPAYPNPFNPTAVIPFSLPEDGKVRVEVFDLTGRLVSVLANQNYKAGTHQVTFDASGLASGVYMVQVQFNGAMESQMITLIK